MIKQELKTGRLLTKKRTKQLKIAAAVGTKNRRSSPKLKCVQNCICESTSVALSDFEATPSLWSYFLAEQVPVTFEKNPKRIITASGVSCVFFGVTCQAPVSFESVFIKIKFLVLQGRSFDIIIGRTEPEEMPG